MYYKYLPCQILSDDFDKKSDFLSYEFLIRLPAITQFKNGLVQRRVGSREDVMSSNQDIKTSVTTLACRRGVWGSCFILHRVFLSTLAMEKIMRSSLVALFDVMMSHPPSTQLSLLNQAIFELSNGGQSYREFVVQKVKLLVKVMAQNFFKSSQTADHMLASFNHFLLNAPHGYFKMKGFTFLRNCGATSVRMGNTKIWYQSS